MTWWLQQLLNRPQLKAQLLLLVQGKKRLVLGLMELARDFRMSLSGEASMAVSESSFSLGFGTTVELGVYGCAGKHGRQVEFQKSSGITFISPQLFSALLKNSEDIVNRFTNRNATQKCRH